MTTVLGAEAPADGGDVVPEWTPAGGELTDPKPRRSLGRLSAVLAVIVLLGKGLGFVREVLVTRTFGASGDTDAFYLGFSVVVVLSAVVSGTVPKVLIPPYQKAAAEGSRQARAVATSTGVLLLAVTALASLLVWFQAPALVAAMAPEFDADAAAMAVRVFRLLAVVPVLSAFSGTLMAVAQARDHFYMVQLTSTSMNIGAVVGLIGWSDELGVLAVAAGLVGGVAVQALLLLLYPLVQGLMPAFDRQSWGLAPGILGGLALFVVLSQNGGSLAILVDQYFAAKLPEGHYSCMGYAYRLMFLPSTVLWNSVLVALLPSIAALHAAGDRAGIERQTTTALRSLLFLLVPLLFGFGVAGEVLVRLAFGRGAFDADAIRLTALLLLCYAPSMSLEAVRTPLSTVFMAHGRVRTTVAFGLLRVVLMLATYPLVWRRFGAPGLVLTLGAVDFVCVSAMWFGARRLLGLQLSGMLGWALRLFGAVAVALIAAEGIQRLLVPWLGLESVTTQAAVLVAMAGGAAGVYLAVAAALGMAEVRSSINLALSFVRRKRG